MQILNETPILHKKNVSGLNQYWMGQVVTDGENCYVTTTTWSELSGGVGYSKMVSSIPKMAIPKNIGKANETTPHDQALSEMNSRMKKKRDESYVGEGEVYSGKPLAMKALKFTDAKHRVKYPCWAQPKLNGERAGTDGDDWWTRTGLPHIPEVVQHIPMKAHILGGAPTDGELLLTVRGTENDPIPKFRLLQDTSHAISKYYPDDSEYASSNLQYWIFDTMDENDPFYQRNIRLDNMFASIVAPGSIRRVPTYLCQDEADVMMYHSRFTKWGFEGTIIRSYDGQYKFGHRVAELQKLKDFKDGEFRIIDVTNGTGSHAECAMYVCMTTSGVTFTVNPEGELTERQRIWHDFRAHSDNYVGKWLTVRYQDLTKDGIPQFAVGVAVRPERDIL